MKSIATASAVVIIAMVGWSKTANAQQDPGVEYVDLPPDVAACVSQCTSSAARAAASDATLLAKRLGDLERRYNELASQVGLIRAGKGNATGEMAAIRKNIRQLRERLETLVSVTEDEFLRTGIALYGLNESLEGIRGQLAEMDTRIGDLERKNGGVKIGPAAGFLVLYSTDGTLYTGMPVGARLKLNLTDSVDVNIDAAILLSFGKEPVGSSVRGGLTFDLNPHWAIEAGLGTSWVGYNSQLKAHSAFATGDVGVTFRYSRFLATASALVGSEFDSGRPAFALGGNVLLGVEFP